MRAPGTSQNQIERTVSLPAGVDEVWDAITDNEMLSQWFGVHVEMDARPGGRATFTGLDGEIRHGIVHDVEPGHRLVWRWWPAGPDGRGNPALGASTVELVVEEAPEGAALTVVESVPAPTWLPGNGIPAGGPWSLRLGATSAAGATAGLAASPNRD